MVGVPGRSKGCNTCRRRRVKCDEAKPVCQRCVKAGFECLGYARRTIWLHASTVPFAQTSSHHRPRPADSVPQICAPRAVQRPSVAAGSQHNLHVMTAEEISPEHQQLVRRVSRVPIPAGLNPVAFRPEIFVAFMRRNFVWRTFGAGWFDQAAEGRLGTLARDAVMAVCQANFGRRKQQIEFTDQSLALYTSCLGRLSSEIQGNTMAVADLVVPTLLLMSYASSERHTLDSRNHLGGIARLLPMCGPEIFRRQPLLNAFETCCATLINANLVSRQRLFLEDETWRTVPWELDPAAKTHQSRLLDILVTVPGMLEDHDKLHRLHPEASSPGGPGSPPDFPPLFRRHRTSDAGSPSSPSSTDSAGLFDKLILRISTQLEKIYLWRWLWQAEHGREVEVDASAAYVVDLDENESHHTAAAAASPYVQPLRFARFSAAAEIMLYNATLMWLLALLCKLAPAKANTIIAQCAQNAKARAMASLGFEANSCPFSPQSPNVSVPPSPNFRSSPSSSAFSPTSSSFFHSPAPSEFQISIPINMSPNPNSQAQSPLIIPPFEPLRRPGQLVGLRDLAIEIARAYEWMACVQDRADNKDPNGLYLFPVGMAMSVLDADTHGRAWIRRLLSQSEFTEGYGRYGGRRPAGGGTEAVRAHGPRERREAGTPEARGREMCEVNEEAEGERSTPETESKTERTKNVTGFDFFVTEKALDPGVAEVEEV